MMRSRKHVMRMAHAGRGNKPKSGCPLALLVLFVGVGGTLTGLSLITYALAIRTPEPAEHNPQT